MNKSIIIVRSGFLNDQEYDSTQKSITDFAASLGCAALLVIESSLKPGEWKFSMLNIPKDSEPIDIAKLRKLLESVTIDVEIQEESEIKMLDTSVN